MKKFYSLTLIIFIFFNSEAQIVAWDFNGINGDEAHVPATTIETGLNTSKVSRGNVHSIALANSFNAKSWTTAASYTTALDLGTYCEFTVKAKPGFKVSLSSLTASFKRTAEGPRNFQWRYSLDGTNFTDFGPKIFYTGTANNGTQQATIDISGIGALSNVQSITTITIRLYGYNAVSAEGNFAFGRISGDDISLNGTVESALLPLKLLSFNAVNNKTNTRLHWLINCTSAFADFELQRSRDAVHFAPIHHEIASQARCVSPFDYMDTKTPEGINFYRLKMTDIDGKFTYSNILQVNNKDIRTGGVTVYPTIATDHATLTVIASKVNDAQVIFFDNAGKRLKQMKVSLAKGNNNISIDATDLVPGAYRLKVIQTDGTSGNTTLIKR